jgi:hypothetical protein
MTNDTQQETINLLDKDGLADLMTLFTSNGYQDSVQMAANLMLLGLMQYRSFGISEDEIINAVKVQIPLADMVIEVIADSGPKSGA